MELVHCPACGCSVQVADAVLGQRIRCFGCRHTFLATAAPMVPPPPSSPTRGEGARKPFSLVRENGGADETGEQGPFCPGCGRRITWSDSSCPYCGEELESEDDVRHGRRLAVTRVRRDYEPHRGALILSLGNISMIVGGLSLCMFGTGALISVPLGILAWVMANRDLERMRDGRMDPLGKAQTQTGRTGGIAGIFLSLVFASFYALVYLAG
jgi:hypothetical protein